MLLRRYDTTYAIGSETADGEYLIGSTNNKFNGGGAISETGTYLAAIGECVERYSGAWVPWDKLRKTTYMALAQDSTPGVHPGLWNPFHPRQFDDPDFEYRPLTPDVEIHWSSMEDLSTGKQVWVPSQMLYLYPTDPHHERSAVGYATSSGLAFHSTPAEAILGGLYELIERDAFMIAWHSNLSMPLVDVASHPDLSKFMERYVEPSGVEINLVDLTRISTIPSVLAVAINRHTEHAPVALGAAAGPSLLIAAQEAAIECLQTRNWVKAEQRDGNSLDPSPEEMADTIRSFDDHIRFYANDKALDRVDFLISSEERTEVPTAAGFAGATPNEEIATVVSTLNSQGVDVFATDLTSPDVLEARGAVFKVFSPQLQMLDVGFHRRFLGSDRLRTRAHELGLRTADMHFEDFNPLPHPFP
ncbi:YcaO-like family protein [Brevibacterium casei]|uniref:YcaO-like family protein n=1 Tax=Brevibacterium casei TaxID=33889 RepID=UPI0027E41F84|nr:YcaO-like family protein [Brevibacterium casei]